MPVLRCIKKENRSRRNHHSVLFCSAVASETEASAAPCYPPICRKTFFKKGFVTCEHPTLQFVQRPECVERHDARLLCVIYSKLSQSHICTETKHIYAPQVCPMHELLKLLPQLHWDQLFSLKSCFFFPAEKWNLRASCCLSIYPQLPVISLTACQLTGLTDHKIMDWRDWKGTPSLGEWFVVLLFHLLELEKENKEYQWGEGTVYETSKQTCQ